MEKVENPAVLETSSDYAILLSRVKTNIHCSSIFYELVFLNRNIFFLGPGSEGSDTAEISYTRLRNQLKSNPKSRNHKRN
jgi:hypothetical protein